MWRFIRRDTRRLTSRGGARDLRSNGVSCLPEVFLECHHKKPGERDFSDDHAQIFLLKPFVLTMNQARAHSCEPRAKTQEAGPWERLNAAFEVFRESKWLNIPQECTWMSHKWEEPTRGSIMLHFKSIESCFLFFLLVICLENYSCLSKNTTIHYSLSTCLFNIVQ